MHSSCARRLPPAVALVLLELTLTCGAAPASAKPALLAIDDATPTLKAKADGGWAGPLGLTNLTDGALSLRAAPADRRDRDCKIRLSKAAIGAAQSSDPTVTVAKSCGMKAGKLALTLTATGGATQKLAITASVGKADANPDWDQLGMFFYMLPVIAVVLLSLFVVAGKYKVGQPLQYLESTYSFKESWLNNITVIGGVLTGLFGSADVVKAFLGEDADRSIALATVGSAVALVLIGFGPIILTASRKSLTNDEGQLVQAPRVWGLLAATTASVAGAFGQLWIGWKSGAALDLGGWEDNIQIGFWFAALLLAGYTVATVRAILEAGTTKPTVGAARCGSDGRPL